MSSLQVLEPVDVKIGFIDSIGLTSATLVLTLVWRASTRLW
jgi:hypothetical protein